MDFRAISSASHASKRMAEGGTSVLDNSKVAEGNDPGKEKGKEEGEKTATTDTKDTQDSTQTSTKEDIKKDIKKETPLSEAELETKTKVKALLEFYFGDSNLVRDGFLRKTMETDPEECTLSFSLSFFCFL